jgi:hypothetical protein
MSMAEQLKKRPPKVDKVTIDGFEFVITGLSRSDRSAFTAKCRKKDGSLDGDKFDMNLLSERVTLVDGSTLTPEEWSGTDSHISGPLQSVVLNVCGFDKDDIQRDPKDSDSTKT